MEICEKCGQPLDDVEFENKVKAILPPNLKLYDFGVGQTIMPMHAGGQWLTTSISYIYDDSVKPMRFLGFTLRPPMNQTHKMFWYRDEILRRLPEAAALFEQKAKELEEGDSLPIKEAI